MMQPRLLARPQVEADDVAQVAPAKARVQAELRRFLKGDSADVAHHPFQDEIDELVACVLEDRDTSIDVFDAQKTMEVCLAADRSAERGGTPVSLPLIAD